MKIAICGSVQFGKEMLEIRNELEKNGHSVILPQNIEQYASGEKMVENKWDKLEGDVIRNYYHEIEKADAILVVNKTKNNITNYIGGNGLIEMAFAYILNKKIFLLNSIPEINYSDEISSFSPIIINGDLKLIR